MKLGFASAILPDISLEEVFQFASVAGFDCVEMMCWPRGKASRRYAGVTHIDVENMENQSIKRIQKLEKSTAIEISALGYYPNPLSPDSNEATIAISHIKKVIGAARDLGVIRMNTFIGRDWRKSEQENWDQFLTVWEPLIKYAESCEVYIGIENCPMLFTYDEWPGGKNLAHTPAIWKKMFEAIPSLYFGLNYDPSHMIWQFMDYLEPLVTFSKKLFHIHAKDARIDWSRLNQVGVMATPNEFHTPKLPGLGDVNWGKFFSILTDVGYTGHVCVEVEDRAYEGSLEARKMALIQSQIYLRQFIPKL